MFVMQEKNSKFIFLQCNRTTVSQQSNRSPLTKPKVIHRVFALSNPESKADPAPFSQPRRTFQPKDSPTAL